MYMLQKQIRLMTISIFQYFLILVTIKLLLVCPNYNYLHLFLLILNIIQIKTTLSKTNVSINEIERSLNKVILTSMILFFSLFNQRHMQQELIEEFMPYNIWIDRLFLISGDILPAYS